MIDPEAIKIWNETISHYFNQMDIGAMRGKQFISPRLDLSNMESVVLHCYDAPFDSKDPNNPVNNANNVAKKTFSNNPDIYPPGIRNNDPNNPDFNWNNGIITRVRLGNMPPAPTNSPWPKFWCDNLENWVTKFWPPVK